MTPVYLVDAKTEAPNGTVIADYHLETSSQPYAESEFIRCWFSRGFWDVRIRKEWKKDDPD